MSNNEKHWMQKNEKDGWIDAGHGDKTTYSPIKIVSSRPKGPIEKGTTDCIKMQGPK